MLSGGGLHTTHWTYVRLIAVALAFWRRRRRRHGRRAEVPGTGRNMLDLRFNHHHLAVQPIRRERRRTRLLDHDHEPAASLRSDSRAQRRL